MSHLARGPIMMGIDSKTNVIGCRRDTLIVYHSFDGGKVGGQWRAA